MLLTAGLRELPEERPAEPCRETEIVSYLPGPVDFFMDHISTKATANTASLARTRLWAIQAPVESVRNVFSSGTFDHPFDAKESSLSNQGLADEHREIMHGREVLEHI